tara:strand:- start:292 stop:1032 length:741 start_codon:yes stop_codon:yes gene_type:complete
MSSIEDNPSFSGDIRLYSHSGLCNRLRLIAEYKHLSDVKNKKIEMFWVKCIQCNALFKDLFQPIPNINFSYLKQGRKSVRPPNTAQKLKLFSHDKEIKYKNHLIFKPTDDIMENIEGTKERIGEDYIACHIRRADIITIQKKYNVEPPSDEYFEDFMKSHPDRKIYLATDSRQTQDRFIEKFGNRVYYSNIPSGNGSTKRPNRTTPVQEAVVDLFLCIGSVDFLGTDCSSFSGFIKNYRKGKNAKT